MSKMSAENMRRQQETNRKAGEEAARIDKVVEMIWEEYIKPYQDKTIKTILLYRNCWHKHKASLSLIVNKFRALGYTVDELYNGEPDVIEGNKFNYIDRIRISWADPNKRDPVDIACP